MHPTPMQTALYARLLRTYGKDPEWEELTRARRFERMTPHRAAHFIQRLLDSLAGQKATVPCGCTGHVFADRPQKRSGSSRGISAARLV